MGFILSSYPLILLLGNRLFLTPHFSPYPFLFSQVEGPEDPLRLFAAVEGTWARTYRWVSISGYYYSWGTVSK